MVSVDEVDQFDFTSGRPTSRDPTGCRHLTREHMSVEKGYLRWRAFTNSGFGAGASPAAAHGESYTGLTCFGSSDLAAASVSPTFAFRKRHEHWLDRPFSARRWRSGGSVPAPSVTTGTYS